MWEDHPMIDDFEALFRSVSRPAQAAHHALAARHFLAGCTSCRDLLRGAGWDERRLDRLLWLSAEEVRRSADTEPPWTGHGYGQAFAGAEQSLTAFFGHDRPLEVPREVLLTELLRLPEGEQGRHAADDPRFAHPEVVRGLIDQSHQVRYDDPREMVHLADLARRVAESCTLEATGNELRLADLRARGWMQYGNALRVCGELQEAEEALVTAQRFRAVGTHDPLLRARLLEHLASLRTFQGKFQNAIELADSAGEIYRELGERHCHASTMVQKAIAAIQVGQTEDAIGFLNRAIPKIDPEENPHLLLAACHNLIRCYIDLDRPEQALSLYFESRELYKEFTESTTILLRAGWQEGQLLRDLGHLGAAEAALLQARQGFMERGLALEVALVSLDLASVYVRTGKVEELKRTVAEAVPIFRALRVGREAIGSLLQLQQAAGQEQQALELIRALNTRLAPLSRNAINK
jgi:tetratricopeptide (TPR) repeat protein